MYYGNGEKKRIMFAFPSVINTSNIPDDPDER